MKTDAITIRVDPETAQAYRSAAPDERDKINTLLALKLREAVENPGLGEEWEGWEEEG